ncbi:response regulator transcription factor [Thermoflexus sp.]|uniref:response regulator transcription factor n=1 Tax=Thermoflexus sp. TaxID=1969742 RepID=UPI0025DF18A4|nr:response regulator transcription factor [Thermoflexus sp.]MDW8179817.1 response regulator transcription factor [Anaerolineae bacterium]MCS6962459.1 response regulator transcription factor [Thermoflexus sp.]MCS7350366.1 response regulator transcription factor [Thermoflexus sp.]MCX7689789.1 response regulator transcription factor [Thermoflexus sp.]MDW8184278.1 response regulator transcription factor [Anaerolineae bacterium]
MAQLFYPGPGGRWDGNTSEAEVRVLVVDSSPEMQRLLQQELSTDQMVVFTAAGPSEALALLPVITPHLILTEIAFPDHDGLRFCQQLRAVTHSPILVISAPRSEQDVIRAFDMGADDFIPKPFAFVELRARIQAHLRRQGWRGAHGAITYYADDHLVVDLRLQEVRVRGQRVRMSRIEYRLLACLLEHAGRVVRHETLLRAGWEDQGWDAHYLKLYIRHLRNKIEPDPSRPRYIVTVWGVGYRFCPQNRSTDFGESARDSARKMDR